VAGVTGTKSFDETSVRDAIANIRAASDIPATVGFGIKTPEQAAQIARFADGAVVGSAIVSRIADIVATEKPETIVKDVVNFCKALADSVHGARA
jgi:tryptophan synthase alpha chain